MSTPGEKWTSFFCDFFRNLLKLFADKIVKNYYEMQKGALRETHQSSRYVHIYLYMNGRFMSFFILLVI